MKPYLIDKEPVNANDIIRKAKEYGYEGYGGVYQSSVAAGILRKNGHTVEENKETK